jgi:phage gp45-like
LGTEGIWVSKINPIALVPECLNAYFSVMKNLYTFFAAVLLATSLHAQQVITSVANGNATSPFTWSCTCIPMDGDSITINHTVTLDVDYAFSMGGIHIDTNGTVNGNTGTRIFGVSGGYFINDGTLNMGYVAHNGGSFVNNFSMTVGASLLIDQTVTFVNNNYIIVGDTTYVNTNATFQNNGTFWGGVTASAGTIDNLSSFMSNEMLNTGTVNHDSGSFMVQGPLYNTGNITFNASGGAYQLWNAENFTVNDFADFGDLYNGDTVFGTATFTNNYWIGLGNLFNSEDINGTGLFCIIDSTVNSGAITGTVDICDQSGGNWDINIGTEAGTVTHCANGPCTWSIDEQSSSAIGISPNPSNEIIKLQLPKEETGVVEVFDITGRVVLREDFSGIEMLLNVFQLPEGIYTVAVKGDTQQYTGRFVKQ